MMLRYSESLYGCSYELQDGVGRDGGDGDDGVDDDGGDEVEG